MDYAEFVHHIAYYQMCPWGDDWDQASVNAWASVQPHIKRRMKPQDFKPKTKSKPQSPDYIFGFFRNLAMGAEAQRKAQSGGK